MSSSSVTLSGSAITCDMIKLRKIVFDILDSSDSSETIMSTKELKKICEKELKLPKDALKAAQNKELFKNSIKEFNTPIETTSINSSSSGSSNISKNEIREGLHITKYKKFSTVESALIIETAKEFVQRFTHNIHVCILCVTKILIMFHFPVIIHISR
jgi:formate-dependent phosphoribosylglycinamide formyltransferase (GAR transformylase)